jgi:hypothetical protein
MDPCVNQAGKEEESETVREEDFEIMPEKEMAKQAVNFVVAPEGNNRTTHGKESIGRISNCSNGNKMKAAKKKKELSKAAFEKILMEVKNQDKKLKETNKSIAVSIHMLQEQQLSQGIKITKLQRELTEKIKNFEISRLKNIPLRQLDFERDFKFIDTHLLDIRGLYEKLDTKCNDWKQHFKKHNMEQYTLVARNDTIPKNMEPFYVDPLGYTDVIPPDDSNNYYEPCPVHVNRPSCHHQCQFITHHRRRRSPRKRNSCQSTLHTTGSFEQEIDIQHRDFDEDHHQPARKKSEEIFRKTWEDKERIQVSSQYNNAPFTRIKRAFMASAISTTTDGELEQDEEKARAAAIDLKLQMTNIDADDRIKAQQLQIETLT